MDILDIIKNAKKEAGFIEKTGIEYGEIGEGCASGKVKLTPDNLNPFGAAHGGLIFTLADTIGGTAAMTRGSYVCTLSTSVQFLSSGANTEYLWAYATEIRNGRTISVYDVMIKDDHNKPIAKATINYYKYKAIEQIHT